ncbi:hypothetical protein Scep_003230 [Stephania cephalantha]|uniref:Metallothionein n=1 Tax=Stephania cephalantha TaxID=152367 RepID=A0AAP0PXU8_9MAGN
MPCCACNCSGVSGCNCGCGCGGCKMYPSLGENGGVQPKRAVFEEGTENGGCNCGGNCSCGCNPCTCSCCN